MIRRTMVVAASALALGISAGFVSMGCDKPDPCTAYCDKDLTCSPPQPPDTTAIPKCIQSCHDLSAKDPAYAAAIDKTASCFESTSCADLRTQACAGTF